MRAGLREMLASQSGVDVAGEAVDLEDVQEGAADVAIFAPTAYRSFHGLDSPSTAILLLTDSVEDARKLWNSTDRACGVIATDASEDELGAAVRALGEGLRVGSPALINQFMRKSTGGADLEDGNQFEPLTLRETEVIQWMAQGLANKQIALKLGISEHTVKFHLSALYAKLNCTSRTEAVRRGIELGLISL